MLSYYEIDDDKGCEAVFSIKVLLASESKMESMNQSKGNKYK